MDQKRALNFEILLNSKMNFNRGLTLIRYFYKIYNIKSWIEENDLENLMKVYFKICQSDSLKNSQKKYLSKQLYRLILVIRYRTSVMLDKLKEEKNAGILFENIINIRDEKKMVSTFFKNYPEILEKIGKLKIDDDLKNALSLREKIDSSKTFTNEEKEILLKEFDQLLNIIIQEDDFDIILSTEKSHTC